ncbi:uncharacterized protein LOC144643481 [Oculina patagonica]
MAAHTKVIPNNCVSEIKIPRRVESANGVDYNPVLDLFVTFSYDYGVSLWNPVSGKVVAEFNGFGENFRDTMFVPGNRIAVSSSEAHHGGSVEIFNLGKDKYNSAEFVKEDEDSGTDDEEGEDEDEDEDSTADFVIEDKDLPMTYPGAIALSPGGNLLVTDAFNGGEGVYEIFVDWDNLKVLKSREIMFEEEEAESGNILLCCSPDFKVTTCTDYPPILSSAKVCLNTEEELQIQKLEKITYYMLNGEEKHISQDNWGVTGLVHDGQNLIIANEDEIVLLESMTEGSIAHLIASDVKPSGQIRLNHEGQLMVCEEKVIKLFEYKCNPRSLQDLCRSHVRNTICTGYIDKVNSLEIPSMLKKYLLFK